MAFSAVSQFTPGDEGGMNRFLFEHYLEHQQFASVLLAQTPPAQTTTLPIQKMDKGREQDWLLAHQQMTQSVWTGLGGGQSAEFSRVDWNDPDQLLNWMQDHAQWHAQVRELLSL